MEQTIIKNQKALRCGYTTGSCAAAAAAAATALLLSGNVPPEIFLPTPKGIVLRLEPVQARLLEDIALCAIQKDSGDDPDVTNGIFIFAQVKKTAAGYTIAGGQGVGRVTRPGLACAVGQAAINPVPRQQILDAAMREAQKHGYTGGLEITISAQNGEQIAKRTFNSRLGIIGGISILGTSGIVEPMSEQALIDTIHVEIDSHFAAGQKHILACPGNYGQDFLQSTLQINMKKAVTISNFVGEALDYAIYKGAQDFLLVGHAGKLVKLAAGVMQTHSSMADGRQEIFAAHAALQGAPLDCIQQLMQSITVDECIAILQQAGFRQAVLSSISQKITEHLQKRTHGDIQTEFIIFTNQYSELLRSAGAGQLLQYFQEEKA